MSGNRVDGPRVRATRRGLLAAALLLAVITPLAGASAHASSTRGERSVHDDKPDHKDHGHKSHGHKSREHMDHEQMDNDDDLRVINVDVTYRTPPGSVDGVACRQLPTPGCGMTLHGTEKMTGTFQASGPWDGFLAPKSDGEFYFTGNNYMTGVIQGCGMGSFVYEDIGGVVHTAQADARTQSIPAENDWRIRPETATGELAGRLVSASGHQVWRSFPFNQDASQENWDVGTITGTVICRVP